MINNHHPTLNNPANPSIIYSSKRKKKKMEEEFCHFFTRLHHDDDNVDEGMNGFHFFCDDDELRVENCK